VFCCSRSFERNRVFWKDFHVYGGNWLFPPPIWKSELNIEYWILNRIRIVQGKSRGCNEGDLQARRRSTGGTPVLTFARDWGFLEAPWNYHMISREAISYDTVLINVYISPDLAPKSAWQEDGRRDSCCFKRISPPRHRCCPKRTLPRNCSYQRISTTLK
jgi:hypothetical protein